MRKGRPARRGSWCSKQDQGERERETRGKIGKDGNAIQSKGKAGGDRTETGYSKTYKWGMRERETMHLERRKGRSRSGELG